MSLRRNVFMAPKNVLSNVAGFYDVISIINVQNFYQNV